MHLNFSDTSPLKKFAKSIRSIQIVYIRKHLSANVYALPKGDIERLYTNSRSGKPSKLQHAQQAFCLHLYT